MTPREFIEATNAKRIIIDGRECVQMFVKPNNSRKEELMDYCKEHKAEILTELVALEQYHEDYKELELSVSGYYELMKANHIRQADDMFNSFSGRQKAFIVAREYVYSSAYNMNRYGSNAIREIVSMNDSSEESYVAVIEQLEKNYEESLKHIRISAQA